MSARLDMPLTEPQLRRPAAVPAWHRGIALLLAAVAAAALAALALAVWVRQARPAFDPGPPGERYAVQLQNGQMFFGVLGAVGPGQLQLTDVYYVQPFTQANGQPGNRLVSRRKNDWHGPAVLTIPVDKVVTIEAVGRDSQLANLIRQDQAAK